MKISLSSESLEQVRADLLVIGVGSTRPEQDEVIATLDKALGGILARLMKEESFSGQPGETLRVNGSDRLRSPRLLVVGLGQDTEPERRARVLAVEAARAARDLESVALHCRDVADAALAAAAEGLTTGAYRYLRYLTGDRRPKRELKRASLLVGEAGKAASRAALQRGTIVGDAINLARDLVNAPPNDLYPETLALAARQASEAAGIQCRIFNEKQLGKLGMQLFLAVGQGSARPPRMVHMTYTPKGVKARRKVVLVGKGLTFDSGGLCIKPAASMMDMKCDMAGAAVTLAVTVAAAKLKLPVEVHGLLGAAENMNGSHAFRPGDVFTSRDGKTVEIINTDAEGRLVLADVLSYARELKPDFLIDHATLTGACMIALGNYTAGLFSNDEELANRYRQAAQRSGESYWQLPLLAELKDSLKSGVADLKHTGSRYGGAITASLFLQEFVGDQRWAHVDIAGPSFLERQHGVHPRGGTGFGVLTALKLLESLETSA